MSDGAHCTILIVDDAETNRYVLGRMLERAGFTVVECASGAAAIAQAVACCPDLILLDVMLPDVNGLEVCRQLKNDPRTSAIPVLQLSANFVRSEDKVAGLDSGADGYLTQPVDPRELVATVNSLLRARRAEDALRKIQWLLHRSVQPDEHEADCEDPQRTEANTCRLLLDSVGPEMLREIASESLDLLDTSAVVYEANGDTALSLQRSPWCRMLEGASRRACGSADGCGFSCWNCAARKAIEERRAADVECFGRIRVYALPILAGTAVVGSICIGYGDPPRDPVRLGELAAKLAVSVEELQAKASSYESRPPFIIDVAKKRLHTAARLIGAIVDRKRTEMNMKAAKEAAEAANRAKDQFLASLSHELRTPLTPVLMAAAEHRRDPALPPAIREDMEMIHRNVQLETRLIDDLLDVTRITRGKMMLQIAPTDLRQVIAHAADTCMAEARGKGLELLVDTGRSALPVSGDAARLQQIFWNLIKNAVKFTAKGQVRVRARIDAQSVVTTVEDDGIGMDPAMIAKLFNAFEQGGPGTTKRFGGLGLGLAISKALVLMHRGGIRAQSAGIGRGSTFTVTLPLSPSAAMASTRPDSPLGSRVPTRLLLVEDHDDSARTLAKLLRKYGHEVKVAGDVATALRMADAEAFDVVVSDIGLPDGTGLELMRQLALKYPALRGIAVSGHGMESDLRMSREAGFVSHLVKPLDPKRLDQAIADVLAQRPPAPPVVEPKPAAGMPDPV